MIRDSRVSVQQMINELSLSYLSGGSSYKNQAWWETIERFICFSKFHSMFILHELLDGCGGGIVVSRVGLIFF